jgi:hypothetical protein
MSNSFRIRTEPGVDKSLNVLIDQEFEYLEILSLKLLQSQIYTRQCSDYGVIVGRVSVNNGFGIPNAKVSVFIPLDTNDELNPVTSDLYPYKTLTDLNEDGYRYNLLPYVKSHSGHNPTGTFFNREDVLTDPTLIQVYDKYFKYSTVTNSSGDYMIFGVPTGSQTVVVDIDLSDIGEFSLSPQDLIRMGLATPAQVAGINFKSSTNLNSLPQIINFNRTIEVEPLWGQPEICNLGITRTDFDLSKESGIDIRPTSIFMGSIVSSNDDEALPRNCKPRLKSGSQCTLVTGPGEILAIRQTIFLDAQGKPILETVDLEEGGQVIDDNGAWLVDVPMNLDYLITNEFGEQVISDDPKKGIPTKGKYRFKVKWNQSPSISEPVRRGYFLVPNVKEHGWTNSGSNPNATLKKKSYAFSLDWDDYVDFQSAIDCTDTFYLMQYNKVYTVSQLVDQYRKGYLNTQFIGIKNILDESCESENNKFPTNDGVFRFDLIYFLFWIMLFLFRPIFFSLIPVIHILWAVLKILALVLTVIIAAILTVVILICGILYGIVSALANLPNWLGGKTFKKWKDKLDCPTFADLAKIIKELNEFPDKLKNIKIPNLSYPECSFCDCGNNGDLPQDEPGVAALEVDTEDVTQYEGVGTSLLTPFQISSQYNNKPSYSGTSGNPGIYSSDSNYQFMFAGQSLGFAQQETLTVSTRVPEMVISTNNDENTAASGTSDPESSELAYFTSSLTIPERLNLFNTKAKYFNESPNNPGGGVNRIKVTFQPDLNVPTSTTNFHYDNVIAIVCTPNATDLEPGTMLSFQDFALSKDKNVINTGTTLNEYGTNTITGTTINSGTTTNPGTITINYANPDGSGNMATPVTYQIVTFSGDPQYARFPMDVEYFQVITGMTYSEYSGMCNSSTASLPNDWNNNNSFNNRFLSNDMRFYRITQPQANQIVGNNPLSYDCGFALSWSTVERFFSPVEYYKSIEKQRVIFLVRGVDPNSSRTKVRYDLSRLFGYNFDDLNHPEMIVQGDKYKLNYPIQGTINCVNHITTSNITSDFYFDSFRFRPSITPPPPTVLPPLPPLPETFGFSSFTSNLHTFYSNLDSTNGSFTPGQGAQPLSSVTLPSSSPIKVVDDYINNSPPPFSFSDGTQGWNGFIVEWDILYTRDVACRRSLNVPIPLILGVPYNRRAGTENVSPNDNRGYYPGEIVEGGSMFYQRLDINQSNDRNNIPLSSEGIYYAPKYPSSGTTPAEITAASLIFNLNSTNQTKIVMRSDRLPTSTLVQNNLGNSFPLHTNGNFVIFVVTDDGATINQSVGGTGSSSVFVGEAGAFAPEETVGPEAQPSVVNQILESFNCGSMAPLGCYYSETFDGKNNLKIYDKGNPCWSFNGGKNKFDGGCYILITQPIISLLSGQDFQVVSEWTNRVQVMFGACRNVFSHLFTNNWINGVLYPFSFSNDISFNSQNQPVSNICNENIYFDQDTNNFYYRSSPWNNSTSEFVGMNRPEPNPIIQSIFKGYGGNIKNLKYPTTIMDLGPRNLYIQELVMSDDFDGYVMNRLNSSSYGDVSELLNLLIITRLASPGFLQTVGGLLGSPGIGILSFFSRTKLMVDGDYAQMIAINSELSVAPFQSLNYPDNPVGQQNPIYYNPSNNINDVVFGVFFSSDTQTRDFISPKRTIIDPDGLSNDPCTFSYFSVFTQTVPFYQWNIKGEDTNSIFGSQENGWYSEEIDGNAFFSYPYQLLDRIEPSSRYMRTSQRPENKYFKGYIYSVYPDGTLNPEFNSIEPNSPENRLFNTGAPFYFYFGLKKGKSAFDRFTTKWLDTTTTL